jgi:hypothetical protein
MGATLNRFKRPHWQFLLQTLAVLVFLCLELLLDGNMGEVGWNEIDVLPLSRQFVQPNWVPEDWYLNQPAGYRLLFQATFGWLAAAWGFLAASILGRLVCYSFFAFGLVWLGRRLGLTLPLLLLALILYLHSGCDRFLLDRCAYDQGAIAGEWMIGSLESKAVAYSLLPLAIGWLLTGRYRGAALLLGLMTSLHVLVGGWAFLVGLGWILLHRRAYPMSSWYLGSSLLIYMVASGFAIPAIVQQLTADLPATTPLAPSYIYVFLRLAHHLNPLSWSPEAWIRPIVLLIVLGGSVVSLRRQRRSAQPLVQEQITTALRLASLVGMALIPFGIGLLIAPFDLTGRWLQYYPFRLGDVLLPLGTCLLLACALQHSIGVRFQRSFRLACILLLGLSLGLGVPNFYQQVLAVEDFPAEVQGVDPAWRNFTRWIRRETPKGALVISPPVEFTNFTWLTRRPTIAKFKFLPQNSPGILDWYERLTDLGGGEGVWAGATRSKDNPDVIEDQLTAGYYQLTAAQVQTLMQKYQAAFFATQIQHQLDLPIAYRNDRYVLYTSSPVSTRPLPTNSQNHT